MYITMKENISTLL